MESGYVTVIREGNDNHVVFFPYGKEGVGKIIGSFDESGAAWKAVCDYRNRTGSVIKPPDGQAGED